MDPAVLDQMANVIADKLSQQIGAAAAAGPREEDAGIDLDEDGESADDLPSWTQVLHTAKASPTSPGAKALVGLLQQPPKLADLKKAVEEVRFYENVPVAPPPRAHRVESPSTRFNTRLK